MKTLSDQSIREVCGGCDCICSYTTSFHQGSTYQLLYAGMWIGFYPDTSSCSNNCGSRVAAIKNPGGYYEIKYVGAECV